MQYTLFLILGALLASCTHIPQKLDPKVLYKRDMELNVNGHQGEGVLVVPEAQTYDFEIEAKGKLDLFTFSTCHREQTKEKAGERGWFANEKRRRFQYIPAPLESESISCPAELGGYERKKGRHSWGFVDFENSALDLPALVSCNGNYYNAKGVSACQSYAGAIQEIEFAQEVLAPERNTCIILKSNDGKRFRFRLPKGRCSFRFVTMDGRERWHRLTTIGYEEILIRE